MLIGVITTHKFRKILCSYCQFHTWWGSSDDENTMKPTKKDLSNITLF